MRGMGQAAGILLVFAAGSANAAAIGSWGVSLNDQDRSVHPGDDFAMYQNGGWFARTELGPSLPNSAYWRDLRVGTAQQLARMVARLASEPDSSLDPAERKAADVFRSAIDETEIERRGLEPIRPRLRVISAAKDRAALARLVGAFEGPGTVRNVTVRRTLSAAPFSLQVAQDQKDPSRRALNLGQAGMLLAGPEYYLDPQLRDVRQAYRDLVARLLTRIGWPEPERNADAILGMETKIARVSWSHEKLLDPTKTYNPTTISGLQRAAPSFPWSSYFAGAVIPGDTRIVVDAPDAIRSIARIYGETPLATLKARQAFAETFIEAQRLPKDIRASVAAFAKQAQLGLQVPATPEFAGEQWVENCLPEALSSIYVRHSNALATKQPVVEMATNLRKAFAARIDANPWLSPEGRLAARAKLDTMTIKIGYPDRFLDYRGLKIRPDDLFGNVERAASWSWQRDVESLRRKVDPDEWALRPFYPQYLYSPTTNSVEIPAALLVPPFFDASADKAVNYGAIGTVIASTMITGFDRSGIAYDPHGRLRDWFPASDKRKIDGIAASLADKYSHEAPLPGLTLKGELVADEALDDLGGIQIALDAFHISASATDLRPIDDYDADQRFFLSRAQSWRAKFSTQFLRNQIATAANAPPYMRINGPLPEIPAWYSAFAIKPGDRLYIDPEARVASW